MPVAAGRRIILGLPLDQWGQLIVLAGLIEAFLIGLLMRDKSLGNLLVVGLTLLGMFVGLCTTDGRPCWVILIPPLMVFLTHMGRIEWKARHPSPPGG